MRSIPRTAVAAAVVAATAAGLEACAPPAEQGDQELTLVIAVDGLAANWDPLTGGVLGGHLGASAFFDSLLVWDYETATGEPNLAEEVVFADDRRSIEIRLRDDVDFADGTRMTADGVKRYLEALFASPFALNGSIQPYDPEFTVTGEYTLVVATSKPFYTDFVATLFHGVAIASPAVIDDPGRAAEEPLGSGPYLIEDVSPDVEMTLVRDPDYWDPEAYPYDTVVLRVITDPTARLNALVSGQIDVAPITIPQAAEAEGAGLLVHEARRTFDGLVVYDPANSVLPALRDVRVREAMMLAFDRDTIAETLYQGYGGVTSQTFMRGQAQYIEGGDTRYGYDLERARDLMAEAGYADGFDVTIPTDPRAAEIQPIVQQSLADIGIRVTYEPMPDPGAWLSASMGGEYPLTMWNFAYTSMLEYIGKDFPGFGKAMIPTAEGSALVEIIRTGDAEASAAASQEFGELLLDEIWFIPFAQPSTLWATAADVDVVGFNGGGTPPAPNLREFIPLG